MQMFREGHTYHNIAVVCHVFKNTKLFGVFWSSELKGDAKMTTELLVIIHSSLSAMFYDGDTNVN